MRETTGVRLKVVLERSPKELGKMSRCLYRLVGNVQNGGARGRASTSDLSEGQIARRKQVMFAFLVEGGDDLGGSS